MRIAAMEQQEATLMRERQELAKNYSAVGARRTTAIIIELRSLRLDLATARAQVRAHVEEMVASVQRPQEAPPAPKSGPRVKVVAKAPTRGHHEPKCNLARSHAGACSWRSA